MFPYWNQNDTHVNNKSFDVIKYILCSCRHLQIIARSTCSTSVSAQCKCLYTTVRESLYCDWDKLLYLVLVQHEVSWTPFGNFEQSSSGCVKHHHKPLPDNFSTSFSQIKHHSLDRSDVFNLPTPGSSGWCLPEQVSYAEVILCDYNHWSQWPTCILVDRCCSSLDLEL